MTNLSESLWRREDKMQNASSLAMAWITIMLPNLFHKLATLETWDKPGKKIYYNSKVYPLVAMIP